MKAAAQVAAMVMTLAVAGLGQEVRPRGSATIVDSGSTNTNAFRIVVEASGKTQSTMMPRSRQASNAEPPATTSGTIPAALAERLYSDLEAAWPLSSLPSPHCLKSASFGTRFTIEFDGQTTPDLSCGRITDPRVSALARDAREIITAAGVKRNRVE
jgi:hypothetical protein